MKIKKVLITGASKGIGRCIAETLINKGFEVIGTCRNPESVQDKIPGLIYVSLDLNDPKSIANCFKQTGLVDIIINNAGQSQIGALEEIKIDDVRSMFDTNFFGGIELIKGYIPSMRENKSGLIINIGSMTGSFPLPLYSSYCSSKAALQMFSLCLRQELKPFKVNVVHVEPNDIRTTISPDLIYKENGPYEKLAKSVRENVRLKMDKAEDPVVVANLICKIIQSKNPAPKYTVGGNGALMIFFKRMVTDRYIEKCTMKLYGIK